MRNLLVLVGLPLSGKSTWIEDWNLEDYTLSFDKLKIMFNGYVMNQFGNTDLNGQKNNRKIFETFNSLLNSRMNEGVFTVIDAMNIKAKDLNAYKILAAKYGYKLYFKDFRNVSMETLIERSKQRKINFISEEVLTKNSEVVSSLKIPKEFTEINNAWEIQDYLGPKMHEFKDLKGSMFFIGDIHGCFDTLKEFFDTKFDKDSWYVFTGDYIDRGNNNKGVLRLLSKYRREYNNITLLEGNHEKWLRLWATSNEDAIRSKEFKDYTQTEFEDSVDGQYKKRDGRDFVRYLKPYFYAKFNDNTIFACHGGISRLNLDSRMKSLPVSNLISGSGTYNSLNDMYSKECPDVDYMIHGHRNFNNYFEESNYINLEGGIEHEGHLKYVEFKQDGTKELGKIKSNYDFLGNNSRLVNEFRESGLVKETVLAPHLSSFSYVKEAFFSKKWNKLTTKARGLFINTEDDTVVSRGYNKFFNIGELPQTKWDSLSKRAFPMEGYEKSNGYLGVISWDKKRKDKIVTSKTTNTGPYADYLKIVVGKFFDKEKLHKYLENNNVSLVFEVIAPDWDLHVVDYSHYQLILLDVIDNKYKFSKKPYNELQGIVDSITIEGKPVRVKHHEVVFNSISDIKDYMKLNKKKKVEGIVIEDKNGYMFKYKNSWFGLMRAIREYYKKLPTDPNDRLEEDYPNYEENLYKLLMTKRIIDNGSLDDNYYLYTIISKETFKVIMKIIHDYKYNFIKPKDNLFKVGEIKVLFKIINEILDNNPLE